MTSASRHSQLKAALRYHIHYLKRLASHPLLREDQARTITQRAHDFQEALHHHPLNDDLIRAISQAREDGIAPAHRYLDGINATVTQSKVRAVIQDIYQPPFPIVPPLVVFYHLLTLTSEITDLYLARPSLGEYIRVVRDVWQVITKGDFIRYGQRLFAGIDASAVNLGRAREDLGPAMSMIWMTHCVASVATQRCATLHDWQLRGAIAAMNQELPSCLARTRDAIVNDALPVLKTRFRHYAPADGRDAGAFAEDVSLVFVKSLDAVVHSLNHHAPVLSSAGQTRHGEHLPPPTTTLGDVPAPVNPAGKESPSASVYAGEGDFHRQRRRRRKRTPAGTMDRIVGFFSPRRGPRD